MKLKIGDKVEIIKCPYGTFGGIDDPLGERGVVDKIYETGCDISGLPERCMLEGETIIFARFECLEKLEKISFSQIYREKLEEFVEKKCAVAYKKLKSGMFPSPNSWLYVLKIDTACCYMERCDIDSRHRVRYLEDIMQMCKEVDDSYDRKILERKSND